MGIQGLLPFLKKVSRPANIKEFRGCTVAIDSYCWLHRGAFACAEKLATGQKTDQYVFYCMKYINNLLSFGIKPVMVFDGCHLPSKKAVEKTRRERREMNRKKAAQLLREGKRSEARDALVQCIDISPQMALELMNACRDKGVDCIVAPYEADAQLAYLNKIGVAQIIITEDSDLLLFGCERVMFKMDISGNGMLIRRQDLCSAMNLRSDVYTFDKFRYMCILSGCDYLPSLPGIGLCKANKVFQMSRQSDLKLLLRKLPSTLNMNNLTVSTEYIEGFLRANNTFLYQLVYDPIQKKILPLNSYPSDLDQSELYYAGPAIPAPKAYQIALGNMDIHNGQLMAEFDPAKHKPKSRSWDDSMPYLRSIWSPDYKVKRVDLQSDICVIERPSTKGKEMKVALPKSCKRQSPTKRARPVANNHTEIEDELLLQEVTNADLASMYAGESPEAPPPSKRSRASFSEDAEFTSLEEDKPAIDAAKENFETCSTPKNKFAVSASGKQKNKFSLNASKCEVKSRFFAASQNPLHKTSFFDELQKGYGSDKTKASNNIVNSQTPSKVAAEIPVEPQPLHKEKDAKSSPYQAFGFAKSQRKEEQSSLTKHITKTAATTMQFKPVRAEGSICDTKTKQDSKDSKSDLDISSNGHSDSEDTDTLAGSSSTVSLPSSLYSIDSSINASLPNSRQSSEVTTSWDSSSHSSSPTVDSSDSSPNITNRTVASKLSIFANRKTPRSFPYPASQPNSSNTVVDLAADEEEHCTNNSPSPPKPSSFLKKSASAGNMKQKGRCRTTGLSKLSSSSRSGKSLKKPEQQSTINSFFSQFGYSAKKRDSTEERQAPDLPSLSS